MPDKYTHLSLEERECIESSLLNGCSFKEIAQQLSRNVSTISREVKAHRIKREPKRTIGNTVWSKCIHRKECVKRHLCSRCNNITYSRLCKSCLPVDCTTRCPDYVEEICTRVSKPPYVCNGCYKKGACRFVKYYYRAKSAQKEYELLKKEAREGINMEPWQLADLDDLVSPLILQGQSVPHIYSRFRHDIPCSERTLYEYIGQKLLSVTDLDLRRKVKYKKRKVSRTPQNYRYREGRTYRDFLELMADNSHLEVVEMDTVEGKKTDDCVLLTIYFRRSHFMIARKIPAQNVESVTHEFNFLESILGLEEFRKTFPLILTDNGSEFKNPVCLEEPLTSDHGYPRTQIFYCDPGKAYQKGAIEKNHEFIRYVIPKGKSLEPFSQDDIDKLMNHINSYARSTNYSTIIPIDEMNKTHKELVEKLGYERVNPMDINLTPNLLKK